jgi:4-amino-4-deoxy-L-arabinose transferase-like glycosyltransferase
MAPFGRYPTRRAQVTIAILVAGVGLAAVLLVLLRDRPRLARSDNVLVTGIAAQIGPGAKMCREDLELPADTSAVRLFTVGTQAPGPPLRVTFTSDQGTSTGALAGGYGELRFVTARLQPLGADARGRLCFVNQGSSVAGFGGLPDRTPASSHLVVRGPGGPTIRATADLYVDAMADPGPWLTLVPAIFERASVWAPGFVGPWLFWALLVLAPLTFAAAGFLAGGGRAPEPNDPAGPDPPRRLPRAAWAISGLALAAAVCWALVVPPWQGPDEISHFSYVQCLSETGHPPTLDANRHQLSTDQQYAMEAALSDRIKADRNAKPPWSQEARDQWAAAERQAPASQSDGCGRATTSGYSPLYYGLASVGYLVFDQGSIFDAVFGARLISALLGALTVLLVWLFARELFGPQPWLVNTAALMVALLPQFGFISGMVNNDALVNALGALELLLLTRGLRRGITVRLAVAIGVTLAVGYLAKPTMGAFAPVVAAVLLVPFLRTRTLSAIRFAAAAFGGFVAVAAVWSGVAAASGRSLTTVDLSKANSFSLNGFVHYVWNFDFPPFPGTQDLFFPKSLPLYDVWIHQFFASFGWNDTLFPEWIYHAIVVLSLVGVAALIAAGIREREALRARWPMVVVSLAAVASLMLVAHYASYRYFTGYPLEQGRYLFPALAVFGAGAAATTLATGRRAGPALAVALVSVMAMLTYFSLGLTLTRYYA